MPRGHPCRRQVDQLLEHVVAELVRLDAIGGRSSMRSATVKLTLIQNPVVGMGLERELEDRPGLSRHMPISAIFAGQRDL